MHNDEIFMPAELLISACGISLGFLISKDCAHQKGWRSLPTDSKEMGWQAQFGVTIKKCLILLLSCIDVPLCTWELNFFQSRLLVPLERSIVEQRPWPCKNAAAVILQNQPLQQCSKAQQQDLTDCTVYFLATMMTVESNVLPCTSNCISGKYN